MRACVRKVVLRALSANREYRSQNCEVWFANKFGFDIMPEQVEEAEINVQMASI